MSGINETFAGQIQFVVLDLDDREQDDIRRRWGITAQAQYVLVNAKDEIVGRWFGRLDEERITAELAALIET